MTAPFLNPGSIREQVTMSMLLSHLGHQPIISTGDELLYRNVLRDAEAVPTLAINTRLGVWFDRITKKSGDIIDFGMTYWSGLSMDQVLEKIGQVCTSPPKTLDEGVRTGRRRRAVKIPYYHIAETRPLGCNPEITAYLQSRNIWEISLGQLKEVYYYVVDEKRRRKDFFAAGWQNENGGWEVMGRNFAGCLGLKGMTFIAGDTSSLMLFSDYIDYLGWKYANRTAHQSILVMNAPEFLAAAKSRAAKFQDVAVFFNRDQEAKSLSAL